jgi:putative transposase
MARSSRVVLEGHPHHITQRVVRSMDIFYNDSDRHFYLDQLSEKCVEYKVKVNGYCLMSNHVHSILTPKHEHSLSLAIREIHKTYTRRTNSRRGVKGHLFQGRFFSCALDQAHYLTTMCYVERNPVKVKMVKNAWDYKWSSAKYHAGEEPSSLLVQNSDSLLGSHKEWKKELRREPADVNFFEERTRQVDLVVIINL